MKNKTAKVWIARNKGLFEGRVYIYSSEPSCHNGIWVGHENSFITEIRCKEFKELFGFTLRKESCIQREWIFREEKK